MTNYERSIDAAGNVTEWFARVILEAAEACGAKLTEARVRIYAADLAEYPAEQVISAFRRVRREGSGFFPSVPEIRRQLGPSPDDEALLAWTSMETAAMKIGAYQSIEFEDTVAAAALVQVFGSWPNWCEQEPGPELALKRQQFLAAYRDARRLQRDVIVVEPKRLFGLLEGGAGRYERGPHTTFGIVSVRGEVRSAPERSRLEGKTARQLPPGTQQEETNGEARTDGGSPGDGGPRDQRSGEGRTGLRQDQKGADETHRRGGRGKKQSARVDE